MDSMIKKYKNWNKKVSKANTVYKNLRKEISVLNKNDHLKEFPEQRKIIKNLKNSMKKSPSVLRDESKSTATIIYYNRYADE